MISRNPCPTASCIFLDILSSAPQPLEHGSLNVLIKSDSSLESLIFSEVTFIPQAAETVELIGLFIKSFLIHSKQKPCSQSLVIIGMVII